MDLQYIFSEEDRTSKKDYTVLFVPRKTLLCEKHLQVKILCQPCEETHFTFGRVLSLIQFTQNVFSLE
jgi:hypothetical protein